MDDKLFVLLVGVLNLTKPLIEDPIVLRREGGLYASATVMTTDDDVLNFEVLNCKGEHA